MGVDGPTARSAPGRYLEPTNTVPPGGQILGIMTA
ncbi:beta-glucosidase [Colletotrichum higginsianum]|uniref:Beta-glucosidase n=1 Tax=Colletotrichum higginsianum (strain IMI 349063) TaxID=759273 RepID=H1VSY2_COLHI|nr:beta-glucosidase [Colletotrichum higginsianum]